MRFSTLSTLLVSALAFGVAQAAPSPAALEGATSVEAAVSKAPDAEVVYPGYNAIVVYSAENCGGTYDIIPISELSLNTCYYPNILYESIMAYSPTGGTWDLTIFAGLSGCADPVQLPNLNVCYNTYYNGAPAYFSTFYLEP